MFLNLTKMKSSILKFHEDIDSVELCDFHDSEVLLR